MKFHEMTEQARGLKSACLQFSLPLFSALFTLRPRQPLHPAPHPVISVILHPWQGLKLQVQEGRGAWNWQCLRARMTLTVPPILVASALWCALLGAGSCHLTALLSGYECLPPQKFKDPSGPLSAVAGGDNAPERHGRGFWLVQICPIQGTALGSPTGQHLRPTSMDSPILVSPVRIYTRPIIPVPQDTLRLAVTLRWVRILSFPSRFSESVCISLFYQSERSHITRTV